MSLSTEPFPQPLTSLALVSQLCDLGTCFLVGCQLSASVKYDWDTARLAHLNSLIAFHITIADLAQEKLCRPGGLKYLPFDPGQKLARPDIVVSLMV